MLGRLHVIKLKVAVGEEFFSSISDCSFVILIILLIFLSLPSVHYQFFYYFVFAFMY